MDVSYSNGRQYASPETSGLNRNLPFSVSHADINMSENRASQGMTRLESGSGTQPGRPDILRFLFEDIAQLPIITNTSQELWLGIHLKAPRTFQKIYYQSQTRTDNVFFDQIFWETLFDDLNLLEKSCEDWQLPAPNPSGWISEMLTARRDVYGLRRSRLRRFIQSIQETADPDAKEELPAMAYRCIETLAILSGETLFRLAEFIEFHNRFPTLSETGGWLPDDIKLIREQVSRRKKQAVHALTTGYMRYALRVAHGYIGQGLDYADLAQAGFIGLLKAAERFDYHSHERFGIYATSWIWQSVTRELTTYGRPIRIPSHQHERMRKWKSALDKLDDGVSDPTRNPLILAHAGLFKKPASPVANEPGDNGLHYLQDEQYLQAVEQARQHQTFEADFFSLERSLIKSNSHFSSDDFPDLSDLLPAENSIPEHIVDEILATSFITEQFWSLLDPRSQKVLGLRNGLINGKESTLEEIGDAMGLSRERIRQIERIATNKIKNHYSVHRSFCLEDLLPDYDFSGPGLSSLQFDTMSTVMTRAISRERHEIEQQITRLPRSDWHQNRGDLQSGERQTQLVEALEVLQGPAHVTDIADLINSTYENERLDERNVYNLLIQNESQFVLLGHGVFNLTSREKVRAREQTPVLIYCPAPLPDPPNYEDAFFESVLVGQEALKQQLTAAEFVQTMLDWSKTDTNHQKWFLQSVLSAYYLVDLIPYVFWFGGKNPPLHCTLPSKSIQDLRYHCLQTLTNRLTGMPEFWWLFQQYQPARPADLGNRFADLHPHGLDDVLQRLRLLASLGAAQKLKYGQYRLTAVGEVCANKWKRPPVLSATINLETNVYGTENNFTDFIDW